MKNDLAQKYADLQAEVSELKKTLNFYGETAAVALLKSAYTGKSKIFINNWSDCEKLERVFDASNIQREYFNSNEKPERFDISFGPEVAFEDLYVIARVIKAYGVQAIFYSKNAKNAIIIGSMVNEVPGGQLIENGVTIDEFIDWPYIGSTYNLILIRFDNLSFAPKSVSRGGNSDDASNNYSSREECDRNNFDALTDGQYGDYDDFDGDWDSLDDRNGR